MAAETSSGNTLYQYMVTLQYSYYVTFFEIAAITALCMSSNLVK